MMAKRKERRAYQPIWEHAKTHGKCEVKIKRKLVERFQKAIIKEKYMDDEFKLKFTGELEFSVRDEGWPGYVVLVVKIDALSKYL